MGIDFTIKQWARIKEVYGLWWEGKLNRPVIPVILEGKDPGRPCPDIPLLAQSNCGDLTIKPKDIIDRIDYELSKYIFLGDSFPFFNMDCFGPGIIAAFLGAELNNSTGLVWFHSKQLLPISEIHFEYKADNILLNRIKAIIAEGIKFWEGRVILGMPDLGGVLDILAVFRSTENLLLDLYDNPEEVKRLTWEIHDLWHIFYKEINELIKPSGQGYSNWSGVYSDKPFYIFQCDFCYMLSKIMFNEFVKPEIATSCNKLPYSIYHLDGIGQLSHLDSLLEINDLDAVQWVPGEGKPDQSEWPEVFRKISTSKKRILLYNGIECLNKVASQIGTYRGILHMQGIMGDISQKNDYIKKLEKYGICN